MDHKLCQANRAQEGFLVSTGSWRGLLQQERQQAEVKDFEAGAVVDGAAKTGEALLRLLVVARGLPPFPLARVAWCRELARRALACSGTGFGEIVLWQFSRPRVPPDMKMQPGQLMEQVQQRFCEPLFKKVLTLIGSENSGRIVSWTRTAKKPCGG